MLAGATIASGLAKFGAKRVIPQCLLLANPCPAHTCILRKLRYAYEKAFCGALRPCGTADQRVWRRGRSNSRGESAVAGQPEHCKGAGLLRGIIIL